MGGLMNQDFTVLPPPTDPDRLEEHCLRILSGLTLWPEAAAKLLHAGAPVGPPRPVGRRAKQRPRMERGPTHRWDWSEAGEIHLQCGLNSCDVMV